MARAAKNGSKSDPTTADLQAQMEALKSDIADLGEILGAYGRSKGEELKEAARNGTRNLRARGEESMGRAQESEPTAYHQAENSVRQNPAAAVGFAAAAGFVVGMLASRR